jgi:Chromo (CHRromatin Organisation MOdifier) domain
MKIHPEFHISRLEKTDNPENTENTEVLEEEYDVEKIVDKRTRNGTTEYLVKWLGYESDENTWEPTGYLNCPEKVREYENLLKEREEDRQGLKQDPRN